MRDRREEMERGLVEREKETGCQGGRHTRSPDLHQLSRETPGYKEIMSSGGWERWEKHKADEKREREGGFMHLSSRKMRGFQRAGKGKRKERECVMYTHAFAYVCICIYPYIYISTRLRVNRLSTVSHFEHKLMVHLLLVSERISHVFQ